MKQFRIILIFILIALSVSLFSSCYMMQVSFPPDLSNQEPYKKHVGKTVYLEKYAVPYAQIGYSFYPCSGHVSPNLITSSGSDLGSHCHPVVPLREGYPFYLEKVVKVPRVGTSATVRCLGRIEIKGEIYKAELEHTNYPQRFEDPLPFRN